MRCSATGYSKRMPAYAAGSKYDAHCLAVGVLLFLRFVTVLMGVVAVSVAGCGSVCAQGSDDGARRGASRTSRIRPLIRRPVRGGASVGF
jgi:hypothetical protein